MRELFRRAKVNVIDGDDRLNNISSQYKPNLEAMLKNGLKLYGIQIFHYGAPHYSTRHSRPSLRFLNGLFNGGTSIYYDSGELKLNENEGSELQMGSTEIISVGLSNMLVCKWFGIKSNRLSTIETSKKRCDYEFLLDGKKYVYEVKGRKYKGKINEALLDARKKKSYQSGDEKLAIICHLPRDGSSLSIYLYDPEIEDDNLYDEKYYVLKYYMNFARMSGLFILADKIEERLEIFRQSLEWINIPLRYDKQVTKMVLEIKVNNTKYYSLRNPANTKLNFSDSLGYNLHFGISNEVIDYIDNWNLDGLLQYEGPELVDEEKKVSCLKDGTIMYLSKLN